MTQSLSEAFAAALATEGLWLLIVGVTLAGLVRGFSGFGTAMVYMPFASNVLPPVWALTSLVAFDLVGPLPLVRQAVKDGHPRDILRLAAGAAVALPLGLFLLSRIDPTAFSWTVSSVTLVLLALLGTGWRYRGVLHKWLIYSVGAMGGFLGGLSGLAGPPVIMTYMSSNNPIQTIRANILLYLLLTDIMTFIVMGLTGLLALQPLIIGALLIAPYLLANIIGAALFHPSRERAYRVLAYLLILAAALSNLPIFD